MKLLIALLLLVLCAFGTTSPAVHAQSTEFKKLNDEVMSLHRQGKYDQAVVVAKQALKVAEDAGGPDHPDVATSLNSLATLYYEQGQYANAEPLFERSLAIFEKTLGPDHPNVATILNNLAEMYKTQGKYALAEPLYKRAMKIRETTLGPDDLHVAESLNNLAGLYKHQGKYANAELLYKRTPDDPREGPWLGSSRCGQHPKQPSGSVPSPRQIHRG